MVRLDRGKYMEAWQRERYKRTEVWNGKSLFVSGDETNNEEMSKKEWIAEEGETESTPGVRQPYRANETLLDPVQCGPQSAADKAQTRWFVL